MTAICSGISAAPPLAPAIWVGRIPRLRRPTLMSYVGIADSRSTAGIGTSSAASMEVGRRSHRRCTQHGGDEQE
jgi:hypothetical protein